MFKKILNKILLAFKAIPHLCVALIKQLLKLDELKMKEIITDAEFQMQKKKLLGEEKAP